MRVLVLALLLGCGTDGTDYGDPVDDSELPPRGMAAIEAWIADGHHKHWACEPVARDAILGSPHGAARVCSNAALSTSQGSVLPVGAASVKEIYDTEHRLLGHAISRKVGEGDWYWYEFHTGRLHVDGHNTGSCPDCHGAASIENTFVIVRGSTAIDPQLPPTNRAALDAWLAAGHYKSWRCESVASTPRPGSAHTRARICSNAALSTAPPSAIPVGAASVKELYDADDQLRGYAVSRKLGATKADWYWYEKYGSSIYADGVNVGLCANCHSGASSEHTFVIVR